MIFYSQNIFIMTKTHLLVLICALFFNSALWACGYYPENYELRFCMLRADILQQPNLDFLVYTEHWLNYCAEKTQWNEENGGWAENCAEWKRYLGGNIRDKDIVAVLYDTEPDVFEKAYRTQNWGKLKQNTFIKALLKNPDAMDYVSFAIGGTYEAPDPWNNSGNKNNNLLRIELAEEFINNNNDVFLCQRYALQLIRNYYNNEKHNKTINVYTECLANQPTIAEVLAASRTATAYYKTNNIPESVYILAKLFDQKSGNPRLAFERMPDDILSALPLAKKPKERALLHALKVLKNIGPALPQIKKVAQQYPQSPYISTMLMREINKLEGWLLTPEILGKLPFHLDQPQKEGDWDNESRKNKNYFLINQKKDRQYLLAVKQFVASLPVQSLDSNLKHLFSAYLCIMSKDYFDAEQHLLQMDEKISTAQLEQKKMMQIIVTAHLEPLRSESTREKLAQWLQQIAKLRLAEAPIVNKHKDYSYSNYPSDGYCDERFDDNAELYRYLSRQFQLQGDLLTAGLLYRKARSNELGLPMSDYYEEIAFWDYYGQAADIDTLLRFKRKKNKTNFEQFISPKVWASDYAYLDLKGTLAFRQNEFQTAYFAFQKIPHSYWDSTYEFSNYLYLPSLSYNPRFDTPQEDCPVDKTAWMQEASNIQRQLKTAKGTQRAKLCLQMGNIIYNTSYYGNSWMMFNYGHSPQDIELVKVGKLGSSDYSVISNMVGLYCDIPTHQSSYQKRYYSAQMAFDYYNEAYKLAGKDLEIAAQACLMLYFCQNKEMYSTYQTPYIEPNYKLRAAYLNIFNKKYTNTQAFTYLRSVCPDLLHR